MNSFLTKNTRLNLFEKCCYPVSGGEVAGFIEVEPGVEARMVGSRKGYNEIARLLSKRVNLQSRNVY